MIYYRLFLTVLGLFFVTPLLGEEYRIWIQASNHAVILDLETEEVCPSLGELVLDKVVLERPLADQHGLIELSVVVEKDSYSAMALGKRCGTFTFPRGEKFPALIDGIYDLWINGKPYGQLSLIENDLEKDVL